RNSGCDSTDRDEIIYWIDATVTLLPTKNDTVVLLNRRYEQPAFTSQSVYEDITYSVTWKHKFDDHWAANAGFQLYIGDWQAPVPREDWIYTPSVGLSYTHDKHLSAELAYSYDWVENQVTPVPGDPRTQFAEGREYTRHLVSLAVKYAF
ncbi:MAG: transporter, partial [Verrucomicrobia bacterium]|nr:transporter [Verrucomicrobiota bacterium]